MGLQIVDCLTRFMMIWFSFLTFFKKNIYITMNTRRDKQIKIVSPKYKRELYL